DIEGDGVLVQVADGAGVGNALRTLVEGMAEEIGLCADFLGEGAVGVGLFAVGLPVLEVIHAEPDEHSLYVAGVLPAAHGEILIFLLAVGSAHKGGQMAAGGVAYQADALRVQIKTLSVGPQEADGRLA